MTIKPATRKLLVRAIPEEDFLLLQEMAESDERSVEAQARHAIRMSVMSLRFERERRARAEGLAKRLNMAHRTLLIHRPDHSTSLSHVAEAIGLDVAEPVHRWFCGEAEPTFSQVRQLATFLGCDPGWLQHGDSEASGGATPPQGISDAVASRG